MSKCEVTGLEQPKHVPMYMVVDKPENTEFMQKAYAIFATKKEAMEWQLKTGMRATTELFYC